MFSQAEGLTKIALAILFFPIFFQDTLIEFALGSQDVFAIMFAKRALLLLPTLSIIFGCWVTIPCLLSIIVRHKKRVYLSALLVTWWDLFRSIFSFWGGTLKLIFNLIGWSVGLMRLFFMSISLTIQDIILSPLRMAKDVGQDYFKPGIPWISVVMTVLWSLMEAVLFTFILTPRVIEILGNLSETKLSENVVQFPLTMMLFILILGSFAVISTLGDVIKERKIVKIIQISLFEISVFIFEVIFLYREFVDALIPWFNQHSSGDFKVEVFAILSISSFAWIGVRGLTWFLFASSGTPTIMSIIQRTGLQQPDGIATVSLGNSEENFAYIKNAIETLKEDMDWVKQKGDDILEAFTLPPLQIIGASINFCTLLITSNHLFELPFKNFKNLLLVRDLIKKIQDPPEDK